MTVNQKTQWHLY